MSTPCEILCKEILLLMDIGNYEEAFSSAMKMNYTDRQYFVGQILKKQSNKKSSKRPANQTGFNYSYFFY